MDELELVLVAIAGRLKTPKDAIRLSTAELGKITGTSQQTASRYLRGLESKWWVQRMKAGRGFELKLTPEGLEVLKSIHSSLARMLDSKSGTSFEGVIASGIGEGAYYVKEYSERIGELLGFRPYYGTLNVKFDGGRPDLSAFRKLVVEGFKSGPRSFGSVELTPITLHVRGHAIRCHTIVPERTHHRQDLELISKDNLRRKYGIVDGDRAIVSLE